MLEAQDHARERVLSLEHPLKSNNLMWLFMLGVLWGRGKNHAYAAIKLKDYFLILKV